MKKMKNNNSTEPTIPQIRNIPVWSPLAKIEVSGYEWEAIQNGLANAQAALHASQAVMSRNILNGTITMDFEKYNNDTNKYEPMSEEDKAPYVKEFNESVEEFKKSQMGSKEDTVLSEKSDESVLVDQDGSPLKEENVGKIITMNS